jgi:hypothetical protein
MMPKRDLRMAGWIEDFDFEGLAKLHGVNPEPSFEPGMGQSRSLFVELDTAREAMIEWLAPIPTQIHFYLDYAEGAFHEVDLASLARFLKLERSRVQRAWGQSLWREAESGLCRRYEDQAAASAR